MQIISRQVYGQGINTRHVVYKASFVTTDGLLHRIDFTNDGRIGNLCVYTSHEPDIRLSDLEDLLDKIKRVLVNDNLQAGQSYGIKKSKGEDHA